jgi:hypothetical protein
VSARQPCCLIPRPRDVGQWLCVPPFRMVCLCQASRWYCKTLKARGVPIESHRRTLGCKLLVWKRKTKDYAGDSAVSADYYDWQSGRISYLLGKECRHAFIVRMYSCE